MRISALLGAIAILVLTGPAPAGAADNAVVAVGALALANSFFCSLS